ncbi:MAG TPA: PQQ-dependent dehydrogenase, methanol/ethanol family, partial [Woeseiaceae bacterium]|nr:PQQ-dependent dehydrogenase, methanol/ethanol family [Woeseiaceae bacterium]
MTIRFRQFARGVEGGELQPSGGSRLCLLIAGATCLLVGCNGGRDDSAEPRPGSAAAVAMVDGARIEAADSEPGNWLSHGRTYREQRFSPLTQIDADNAARLGLAWYYDLDTNRGQEATPIVVDGIMFVSTAWSKVKALNAATGELLWAYDPEVAGEKAVETCCDVVNRGVAVWKGRVYVGTLDGRLIALDAATGKPVWSAQTTDPALPYSITGAPRVFEDKVVIGNGGAEFGVRGYVSAFDAATGERAWRFYTVPGDPSKPFESKAMERAAETWTGEWWKLGGGGTVWDSIVFDPALGLVYIGIGNGSPWNQSIRSPDGGDNLFLASIVALDVDTGEYVWHYQTTPGESWDYTATQPMILADLEIDGRERKVIMQAPKNGFFYVLDRETGELISAQPFATVTWASAIDPETGRPVENGQARYSGPAPALVAPGPGGAHSWQPMAYYPQTGLVYIP